MITPNRFLDAVKGKPEDPRRSQKNFDGTPRLFRLAVVDPAWNGSGWPKVTFEEEDDLTTKQYPYAGVSPGPGQRVVLARIGGTDVILGALAETTAVGGGYMPAGAPVLYTASGTFVKANYPGLRAVRVRVQGAGGGSGGCAATVLLGAAPAATTASEAGGGGGGGYSEEFILVDDLSASESVGVGVGGPGGAAGANNGTAGGDSSFGSHCTGSGGSAGAGSAATAAGGVNIQSSGGPGGAATGGNINIPGGMGFYGSVRITAGAAGNSSPHACGFANYGGGSYLGAMARTAHAFSTGGTAGVNYGGGASGPRNGTNNSAQAARAGSTGAGGLVIVDLYY